MDAASLRTRLLRFEAPVDDPFPPGHFPAPAAMAAVIVPLVREQGEEHLLYIRRTTAEGDPHSGQVAFPGGRPEPGDRDPEATALRELYEELGIDAGAVTIAGVLNTHVTASNHCITPVVATVRWPCRVRPSATEVERWFTIPLAWLADPAHVQYRSHRLPGTDAVIRAPWFLPYAGETLWGVTARITLRLLEVLDRP